MIDRIDRFVLRGVMRRSCPDKFPRSGDKRKRVSCYYVYLKTSEDDYLLLVKEIDETGLNGLRWNGNCFQEPHSVPFSATEGIGIEIERFIGLFEFTYSSTKKCLLLDWTHLNRLPIIWEALSQFLFSRKDLGLTERVQTLRALVQRSTQDSRFLVTDLTLPALVHGHRWILHPDKERQQTHARLLLESFESSGELKKCTDGAYRVTGKALTTLSQYETERQRHEQMLSQSRHMTWLTFVLILVGAASVYVTFITSNVR